REPAPATARAGAPEPAPDRAGAPAATPLLAPEARFTVQRVMTAGAGVLRSAESLGRAAEQLDRLHEEAARALEADGKTAEPGVETWEATNLLLVARVLVAAALRRAETRGCHWREDRPDRDDATWGRHLLVTLRPDRTLAVRTTAGTAFPPVDGPETGPGPDRAVTQGPPAAAGAPAPSPAPADDVSTNEPTQES
ncbi:hypothetical protein ACFWNM_30830, partial [Streptomyces buecherae]